MLSKERLIEHLKLQSELNSFITPDWIDRQFNWTRAIMVETAELLDHYGWKWWKHQPCNLAQVHLELVDIWHFILSHELQRCEGCITEAQFNILHSGRQEDYVVPFGYIMADVRELDERELMHALSACAATGFVHLPTFNLLLEKTGLSWAKLDLLYRTKNVLNVFRQNHGYKDGTYVKVWGDQEDNEVLYTLMELQPDATTEQLTERLEYVYSLLQKEPA